MTIVDRRPHESENVSTLESRSIAILQSVERDGFCIVDGITDGLAMRNLIGCLGRAVEHRDSSDDGVTYLHARQDYAGRIGYAGFAAEALPPHTDRSSICLPPRLLAMAWQTSATAGGDLGIHDFARLLPRLRREHPAVVAFLGEDARIRYDDGTSDFRGPILQRLDNGRFRLRFRLDKNGFYRFEDHALVATLLAEINRHQHPVRLGPGEMIILDNHRCLHSRTHYRGDRMVLRLLADTDSMEPGFAEASDGV